MSTSPPPGQAPGPATGFQFPGQFEITAVGASDADLPLQVPLLLGQAGVRLAVPDVRQRLTSAGNFVSVTVTIHSEDRAQYEAAHAALRAHPAVRYTL
jgi:putative lipoic acid-binding regulatory protein